MRKHCLDFYVTWEKAQPPSRPRTLYEVYRDMAAERKVQEKARKGYANQHLVERRGR